MMDAFIGIASAFVVGVYLYFLFWMDQQNKK